MPSGPERKYCHYQNQHPYPPKDKNGNTLPWTQARLSNKNPAYQFLQAGLTDNTISYLSRPHIVYSANPPLYIIKPKKFAPFFKKCVKKVLGIDIKVDDEDADEDADNANVTTSSSNDPEDTGSVNSGDNSNPEDKDSTTEPEDADEVVSSSKPNSTKGKSPTCTPLNISVPTLSPFRDSSVNSTMPFTVDNDGLVAHATELSEYSETSPHTQIHLEHYRDETQHGCDLRVVPSIGMDYSNTALRPSSTCENTMLLIHDKGPRSNGSDVGKVYTKGNHHVHFGKKKQDFALKLDSEDVNVTQVVATTRRVHGKSAQGLKSASVFQAFKFEKKVKRSLKERKATNNTTLPPKYDIRPTKKTAGGITFMVFSIEYEENDEDELNFDSDGASTVPSPA